MTGTDDRLAALFAEDEPPARDATFRIKVIEGIERCRVRNQLLLLTAVCVLAVLVLGTFASTFTPYLIQSGGVMASLFAAAALVWASLVAVRQGVSA